jgi:hypothetical protein
MYEKPEVGMGHLVKPSSASIPKIIKILNPPVKIHYQGHRTLIQTIKS